MTKEFYDKAYQADHPSNYGGRSDSTSERTLQLRERTKYWLDVTGLAWRNDAKILEVGCGLARLADIHPGWHGVEYSKTAVERVKEKLGPHVRIFEADAQDLPFADRQFDGVFSWATLEHVHDPNKAFEEIDRVLREGGYALIAPAWNCRSWTVEKLEDRAYSDLSFREKIGKALLPFRELLWVRAVLAFPKRILTELQMLSSKPMSLRFRRLYPRWDLIAKYGHVSDDDAVADIDPHAAICLFKTRGYEIVSHRTVISRLLSRHEPVIVKKPD